MHPNKNLFRGAAPTSAGSAEYTCPKGFNVIVTDIDLCNTTTGILTCSVHLVASGGSATDANKLVPAVSINAKSMMQWQGNQVLSEGDFIQVIASASGVNAHISGNVESVGSRRGL